MSFYSSIKIEDGIEPKKNKSIISRMKRSLSNSSHRPVPLKLHSSNTLPIDELSPFSATASSPACSLIERTFSPITSGTPTPTRTNSFPSIQPLPTAHMTYETFSASSSSLSIHSFEKRNSISQEFTSRPATPYLAIPRKSDARSLFDNKSLDERSTSRSLGPLNTGYAPSPAMYWSRPDVYGYALPPKLRAHSSVEYGGKMYVFGGSNKSLCSDKLYALDLDTFTWSAPRVFGLPPPACRAHSFVADHTTGKLYLFGGADGHNFYQHLYVLDTATMSWSRPHTKGQKPPQRRAHTSMIWNKQLYIFGGGDEVRALNDLYRLDLDQMTWYSVDTTGGDPQPEPRGYHTGNLVGDKWVIYGGSDGDTYFGDIHVLNLSTTMWRTIPLDHKMPRLSHTTLNVGSFLFILAGHDGTNYSNELLMLNLVDMVWETRRVYGQAPTPRGYHTSLLYDSRIFVFGGSDGSSLFDDVYVLDLSSYAYLPQILNFSIDA